MNKNKRSLITFLSTLLFIIIAFLYKQDVVKADEAVSPKANTTITQPEVVTSTIPNTNITGSHPDVTSHTSATTTSQPEKNVAVVPKTEKHTTVYLPIYNEEKEEVFDDLTFELKNGDEIIKAKNDEGEIGAKLKQNTSYSISLLNSPNYTFTPFNFTIKNGSPYRDDDNKLLFNLDVKKKIAFFPKKYTTLYLSVLEGKFESEADVTFEFTNNDETIIAKNDNGQVGAKLLNDTSYLVKLLNNEKYTFKAFNFTIKNGVPHRDDNNDLLVSLDLTKKDAKPIDKPETSKPDKNPEDCGCDNPNQNKVTIKELKIVDSKNTEGDTIKDPLTFIFFNVSKQKHAGEYTSINGKLPKIEMLADDEYEVYLKTNDKYGMKHRHIYAFMNHYPIDMEDEFERYIDKLELIKKDKDYVEPKQAAVTARMQVRYKGKLLKAPVTFEFISNGETLQATSKDGIVSVDLHENVDYMVGVVNSDKYDIETFPVVIKNKQVGKFPYDHRTCWLVEHLDLVDKGTVSTTNPHYTIATKDEKVRISGMDFKDLKLEVKTIDSTTIPALSGMDTLVYDISFINIYRHEVVNLKGDFTVTVPKDRNKKVKAIYYINDFGKLENREAIPGEFNSVITFKTNHFSRYALVYEEKENTTKPEKPVNKTENPVTNSTTISDKGEVLVNTKPTYTDEKTKDNHDIDASTFTEKVITTHSKVSKESQYKVVKNNKTKLPNTGTTTNNHPLLGIAILIFILICRKIRN